jgi:hypothetical protein
MRLPSAFRSALGYRRLIKSIDRHTSTIEQQNLLLLRLADYFAPVEPTVAAAVDTGPSYVNPAESLAVQTFMERTLREQGREPSEDEVERFLKELDEDPSPVRSTIGAVDRRHARHPFPVTGV